MKLFVDYNKRFLSMRPIDQDFINRRSNKPVQLNICNTVNGPFFNILLFNNPLKENNKSITGTENKLILHHFFSLSPWTTDMYFLYVLLHTNKTHCMNV